MGSRGSRPPGPRIRQARSRLRTWRGKAAADRHDIRVFITKISRSPKGIPLLLDTCIMKNRTKRSRGSSAGALRQPLERALNVMVPACTSPSVRTSPTSKKARAGTPG